MAEQQIGNVIYRVLRAHLVSILILLSGIPLYLRAGELFAAGAVLLAVVSFFMTRGLTRELRKSRRQRRLLEDQLARTHKLASIDELSSGIAHEINNPLGIIAQEVQWIEHILKNSSGDKLKEKEDFGESLKVISLQVDRCKEIVHKILSLAGELKPVIQRIEINDLIDHITDVVKIDAAAKQIQIIREFQPTLPPICSDPPLLRQVVLNLLVNATQAIERDGEITVSTRCMDDTSIEITIEDTGCGIPEENLDKIFTPFFSTKPTGKGTGLGLALCRGIIEKLGGSIAVTSDVGKCTAFTINLPVERPQEGEVE